MREPGVGRGRSDLHPDPPGGRDLLRRLLPDGPGCGGDPPAGPGVGAVRLPPARGRRRGGQPGGTGGHYPDRPQPGPGLPAGRSGGEVVHRRRPGPDGHRALPPGERKRRRVPPGPGGLVAAEACPRGDRQAGPGQGPGDRRVPLLRPAGGAAASRSRRGRLPDPGQGPECLPANRRDAVHRLQCGGGAALRQRRAPLHFQPGHRPEDPGPRQAGGSGAGGPVPGVPAVAPLSQGPGAALR